jgi:hypothetical protein
MITYGIYCNFCIIRGMGGVGPGGNLGDYVPGNNLDHIIAQLMQNDPNRHGAPPGKSHI